MSTTVGCVWSDVCVRLARADASRGDGRGCAELGATSAAASAAQGPRSAIELGMSVRGNLFRSTVKKSVVWNS